MDRLRRRTLLTLGGMTVWGVLPGCLGSAPGPLSAPPVGRGLMIDGLAAIGRSGRSPGSALSAAELDDLRRSGLSGIHTTVGPVAREEGAFEATLEALALWRQRFVDHGDLLMPVLAAGDLDRAHHESRIGIVTGIQDTLALGRDAARLATLKRAGLRVVQLTYNQANHVGDGCLAPTNSGLTRFGHEVLERVHAERMLVDLSHSGERTCLEAIAASPRPVAITHTGCAAVAANPRNKSDAELCAVAAGGGVVGIYLMPFLREHGQPLAPDVVRHIEHAIAVCGEDHVGIGTDGTTSAVRADAAYRREFAALVQARREAGISAPGEREDVFIFVPDLNTPDRVAVLGERLLERGHPASRVDKILGANFRRVMDSVWS